ncbi:MAG TPA: 3-carboxy-cis,cis-muconate cycloisomerase, partial [Geminicoccaceae bacterium]
VTVHPIDSSVLGELFSTAAMNALFDDQARLQRMLDVEAALARAQARLGLIPEAAAEEITARARLDRLETGGLGPATLLTGYPIVPLVKALSAACAPVAARYVHWGATTQDIIDTGLVLQIRDGLALLEADLRALEGALEELARRERDTPIAGRTHLQQALPVTFGFKAAGWLAPLRRHRARLDQLRPRVLVVQFYGAAGTLASLGDDGLAVLEGLAGELGLSAPAIGWHTARDGFAEVVAWLGLLGGSLAKIAYDVTLLMQSEVDEAREPYLPGRGGSSTMPQKRNPIASEFVLATAANLRQLVPVMLGAMVQDHERATGPWHAEWLALPQAFGLAAGALRHTRDVIEGLEVDRAAMRRNLDLTRGLISAEAVMMALAPAIGRGEAHHLIAAACREAVESGRHLGDVLNGMDEVRAHLDPGTISRLLAPESYTGLAAVLVDRVLAT